MTEEIQSKLKTIAKNKGIDTVGLDDKELARKVTGLLYGQELLEQSDEAKAAWLLPGGIIGHDFSKTSTETQAEPTTETTTEPTTETTTEPTTETTSEPTTETTSEPTTEEQAEGNSTVNIEEP